MEAQKIYQKEDGRVIMLDEVYRMYDKMYYRYRFVSDLTTTLMEVRDATSKPKWIYESEPEQDLNY